MGGAAPVQRPPVARRPGWPLGAVARSGAGWMPFSAMSRTIDAYVTEILTTKPPNRTMSPGEPAAVHRGTRWHSEQPLNGG
jgi:hypothetical protein